MMSNKETVLECDCSDHSSESLLGKVSLVLSVCVASASFLDRLTPTFAGMLNFRFRIIASIMFVAILLILAWKVSVSKHIIRAISLDSSSIGIKHYSHKKT